MASDSISEHLFFKNFLGGMPPDPLALACFFAQWNIFIDVLGIHIPCFQEDNTSPPQGIRYTYLILTNLDQNPERNPVHIYTNVGYAINQLITAKS